jgi:hypothetical protein
VIHLEANAALFILGRGNQFEEGTRSRCRRLRIKTLAPEIKSLTINLMILAKLAHAQIALGLFFNQLLPTADSFPFGHGRYSLPMF